MFHLASWCFNFASINAVWTTSVWDGPLGAVIVELMPSWFTAMPRSAAWDWHAIIACRFPGPFIEKKKRKLLNCFSFIHWSDFITRFFEVFFSFDVQVWWANQLRSTLEPSHVHPVDNKASQHLCSCRCARIDRLSLYSQGDVELNIDSKEATDLNLLHGHSHLLRHQKWKIGRVAKAFTKFTESDFLKRSEVHQLEECTSGACWNSQRWQGSP